MAYRPHPSQLKWNRYSWRHHLRPSTTLPDCLKPPDVGDGATGNQLMKHLHCGRAVFHIARKFAGVRDRQKLPGKVFYEPYTADECKRIISAFYIALDRGIINGVKRVRMREGD